MHNVHPEVDFESSKSLPRSQNLETVPICIVWQYFPRDNTVCIHKYDEDMKSIDSDVCHKALVHFVMDRASLFTDHTISGRPIRARYKHFRDNLRACTCDNSLTYFNSCSLKWWSSMHGVDTL